MQDTALVQFNCTKPTEKHFAVWYWPKKELSCSRMHILYLYEDTAKGGEHRSFCYLIVSSLYT